MNNTFSDFDFLRFSPVDHHRIRHFIWIASSPGIRLVNWRKTSHKFGHLVCGFPSFSFRPINFPCLLPADLGYFHLQYWSRDSCKNPASICFIRQFSKRKLQVKRRQFSWFFGFLFPSLRFVDGRSLRGGQNSCTTAHVYHSPPSQPWHDIHFCLP